MGFYCIALRSHSQVNRSDELLEGRGCQAQRLDFKAVILEELAGVVGKNPDLLKEQAVDRKARLTKDRDGPNFHALLPQR